MIPSTMEAKYPGYEPRSWFSCMQGSNLRRSFHWLRWSKLCYFVIGTFKELRPRLDTMCPYSVHEGDWTCFIGSAFTNRMSLSWSHLRSLQEKTCVQFTWGKLFWNIFFCIFYLAFPKFVSMHIWFKSCWRSNLKYKM